MDPDLTDFEQKLATQFIDSLRNLANGLADAYQKDSVRHVREMLRYLEHAETLQSHGDDTEGAVWNFAAMMLGCAMEAVKEGEKVT